MKWLNIDSLSGKEVLVNWDRIARVDADTGGGIVELRVYYSGSASSCVYVDEETWDDLKSFLLAQ